MLVGVWRVEHLGRYTAVLLTTIIGSLSGRVAMCFGCCLAVVLLVEIGVMWRVCRCSWCVW